ncbi:MAG: GIY-YIG nuclease family protein [Actinomycetota bacterium]|nr:GIY-YIG nuclease family protein [Actinomycetota bacterium]
MDTIAESMILDGPAPLSAFPELGPFVYYIQCGSFLKIGTSINPEKRCDQLRRGGKAVRPSLWVGNPQLIAYVPGNVSKERELHHQFAAKRDQGEWFLLDEELVEHVADIQVQQCLSEVHVHQQRYEDFTGSSAGLDSAKAYQQSLASRTRIDPEWIDAFAA